MMAIEKFTNGLDAILLRKCKAEETDPRNAGVPQNLRHAAEK
jgi:hypothetical protein